MDEQNFTLQGIDAQEVKRYFTELEGELGREVEFSIIKRKRWINPKSCVKSIVGENKFSFFIAIPPPFSSLEDSITDYLLFA